MAESPNPVRTEERDLTDVEKELAEAKEEIGDYRKALEDLRDRIPCADYNSGGLECMCCAIQDILDGLG